MSSYAPTTPSTGFGIDPATLREAIDAGDAPRILDVRTPAEFETSHISGADNVPLDLLREHRADLADRLGRGTVLVCRSGARADQAEHALAEAGLTGLRVLTGGMAGWEASGAPVIRGRQTWDLERQVRLAAGSLVASSVIASSRVPRLKWLAAAVGSGLSVAAVTNTCAMGAVLSRLPWNRGAAQVDIHDVMASLRAG
ncbi:rhodanese-like domain-containing protein [Nocardioides euryhalodurans]|uniref:DUF2892 domain-containing protein n=1 Tax=Nocardioides euryhalodurans TaxID=2518370 RepID=A0A4P7GMH2_9ACTN|nr:rhodanese-like domain-containing protein [Nocardioides euryhalodurans]QBR93336.1 DUF2892 domain-containing protein [Nocardioides euryhalodurans]